MCSLMSTPCDWCRRLLPYIYVTSPNIRVSQNIVFYIQTLKIWKLLADFFYQRIVKPFQITSQFLRIIQYFGIKISNDLYRKCYTRGGYQILRKSYHYLLNGDYTLLYTFSIIWCCLAVKKWFRGSPAIGGINGIWNLPTKSNNANHFRHRYWT